MENVSVCACTRVRVGRWGALCEGVVTAQSVKCNQPQCARISSRNIYALLRYLCLQLSVNCVCHSPFLRSNTFFMPQLFLVCKCYLAAVFGAWHHACTFRRTVLRLDLSSTVSASYFELTQEQEEVLASADGHCANVFVHFFRQALQRVKALHLTFFAFTSLGSRLAKVSTDSKRITHAPHLLL